ncbi:MAG TPA: hypothetical protein VMT29_06110 [Steroidobacteraceae bacterium]|jgi:hypothetical protein|nr:hypothetical protein [Steroidobacteraceae bacterium]
MTTGIRVCAVLAVTLSALLLGQAASADSGTFESLYGFATNYNTIEHNNGTAPAGINRGAFRVVDSTGGLFVKGQSSAQECVILAKKSSAGLDVDSICTLTNASGHKLYLTAYSTNHHLTLASETEI